jgi:hypothetical protein
VSITPSYLFTVTVLDSSKSRVFIYCYCLTFYCLQNSFRVKYKYSMDYYSLLICIQSCTGIRYFHSTSSMLQYLSFPFSRHIFMDSRVCQYAVMRAYSLTELVPVFRSYRRSTQCHVQILPSFNSVSSHTLVFTRQHPS